MVFMYSYFLKNYSLSNQELLQSIVVSHYGLRHWNQAKEEPQCKWGHRFLGIVELCPFVGLIVTIAEAAIVSYMFPQDIKQKKFLFKGSQEDCNGTINSEASRKIAETLNGVVEGICFDATKVEDTVVGGTCTAMSLAFLQSYFTENDSSESCIARLIKVGENFKTSSHEMRTRQAAYNTIRVVPGTENALQKKVQALALHLGFQMAYASAEVYFASQEMSSIMADLPQGAFLIRMIKPTQNEKLEEYGHSLVYIKTKNSHFFYDPSKGLQQLASQKKKHLEELYYQLNSWFEDYGLTKIGFYQLTNPKN